jgi:hypothetical protein
MACSNRKAASISDGLSHDSMLPSGFACTAGMTVKNPRIKNNAFFAKMQFLKHYITEFDLSL